MDRLIENKEYLLVHVEGDVYFNIEGMISSLFSGKKHWHNDTGHLTIMNVKNKQHSFLYHAIQDIIKYGKESETKGWYSYAWFNPSWGDDPNHGCNQTHDTLFYDEFIWLTTEDLIQFDDVTFLTQDDIWNNFDAYMDSKENLASSEIYECKTLKDLKKTFHDLLKKHHPDVTGSDNDHIRMIIKAFNLHKKTLKH